MLEKLFYKSYFYLKRHAATILTCTSAIGVVGTSVMVAKAIPKVTKKLEEATNEKEEKLTTGEIVRIAGPVYIPSAVVGLSTIACIFAANVLNKKQQASLVSAYALIDSSYKEYKKKLIQLFGADADEEIRNAIAIDHHDDDILVYAPGMGAVDTIGEKHLFYEEYGKRYFEATMNDVLNAEYHLNRNFALGGCISLDEFYEFLGLPPTKYGDILGWSAHEMIEGGLVPWIDFDHRKVKIEDGSPQGLECCVISYVWDPINLSESEEY